MTLIRKDCISNNSDLDKFSHCLKLVTVFFCIGSKYGGEFTYQMISFIKINIVAFLTLKYL